MESWSEVEAFARKQLSPHVFERLMEDRVDDHAPQWHELGLVSHIKAVHTASVRLHKETGIDLRRIALCHDLGKIQQFPKVIIRVSSGLDPDSAYTGHEILSARIAASKGLDVVDCLVISKHHWAYQNVRPMVLMAAFHYDKRIVQRWFLLCALDAVGKGWTEKQRASRSNIANNFHRIAGAVDIPMLDDALTIATKLVTQGDFDR